MKSYSNFIFQPLDVLWSPVVHYKWWSSLRSKFIFMASFLHSNFCVAIQPWAWTFHLAFCCVILGTQELVVLVQSLLLLSKDLSTSPWYVLNLCQRRATWKIVYWTRQVGSGYDLLLWILFYILLSSIFRAWLTASASYTLTNCLVRVTEVQDRWFSVLISKF